MGRDFSVQHKSVEFTVPPGWKPMPTRSDLFLCRQVKTRSRNQLRKAFLEKRVLVHSRPVAPNFRLKGGEKVELLLSPDERYVPPESVPLEVVYEDEHLLAINKQPGVMMHPVGKTLSGTLLNAIHHYFSSRNSPLRPVLLHRLDKNTSGLVMLGKHSDSHRHLYKALQQRGIDKVYLAVCHGIPDPAEGSCRASVAPVEVNGKRCMAVCGEGEGQSALTAYTTLGTGEGRALIGVKIFTGRQHQIRVHMASLGHPLIGDALYGGGGDFSRQALHSYYLRFPHPATQTEIELFAPLPDDLKSIIPIFRPAESHRSTWDTRCSSRPWNPRTWLGSLGR